MFMFLVKMCLLFDSMMLCVFLVMVSLMVWINCWYRLVFSVLIGGCVRCSLWMGLWLIILMSVVMLWFCCEEGIWVMIIKLFVGVLWVLCVVVVLVLVLVVELCCVMVE